MGYKAEKEKEREGERERIQRDKIFKFNTVFKVFFLSFFFWGFEKGLRIFPFSFHFLKWPFT